MEIQVPFSVELSAMQPMDGVILGAGGAPFSLLLNRAQGFTPFS